MSTRPSLDAVAAATAEREKARADAKHADAAWREAIRAAVAAGCTGREVSAVAGVNPARVSQIVRGTRK